MATTEQGRIECRLTAILAAEIGRREFIALLGGAAVTWPLAAHGQQPDRIPRIGVLMGSAKTEMDQAYLANFWGRLEELGWKEGRNARVDVRWWTGGPEHMGAVVAEMLAASPDVIMVFTNLALAVLKPMAGKVPVVFVGVGDPVGSGFVASLAHPGGNITGFASHDGPMGGKWLEVLKETVPNLTRVMTILHPETPVHQAMWRSIEDAAPRFGVEVTPGRVHDAAEIESAITSFAVKENSGLISLPHALVEANNDLFVALELRYRLPAIYGTTSVVKGGGLVSYGVDFEDSFRRTADYVDRILRGDSPADLPVQEPTKFKLAFNLKTAKAIGIIVPPTLLARADEVIE
jgi:putative ABC transport system substrate-binding protein